MWASLAGLALGLLLGLAGHAGAAPWARLVSGLTAPLGQLWLNALQLVVLPLVVTQMFVAVAHQKSDEEPLGLLGLRTIGSIVGLLVAGGSFALLLAPPALRLYRVDPETAEALRATPVPEAATLPSTPPAGPAEWVPGLVPTNLVEALGAGDILGILLFTVAFALAVTRLPHARRKPLIDLFVAAADATMVLVRWILLATPVGVFALALHMAVQEGLAGAGVLAAWVVLVSGLLLAFTGLLYPVTALLGRTSLRVFSRAVLPAQAVAMGTRSSLASLPALVEGGRKHLRLPASGTGFVLPFCASAFKQNRTISSTAKLLFLAHVFGVSLGPGKVVAFLLTVLLLSFGSPGIPRSGGAFSTLPAYVAAGIPVEGIVLLEAVETIPDFFKTLLNVTADMSVAAIVSRGGRLAAVPASDRAEPEPLREAS